MDSRLHCVLLAHFTEMTDSSYPKSLLRLLLRRDYVMWKKQVPVFGVLTVLLLAYQHANIKGRDHGPEQAPSRISASTANTPHLLIELWKPGVEA
jgi:hypothetical protein